MSKRRIRQSSKAGLSPGTPIYTGEAREHQVRVEIIDYGPDGVHRRVGLDAVSRTPPPGQVRWVDLDGVHEVSNVTAIGERFGLHPLVVEDLLNPASRPKAEEYESCLFLLVKQLHLRPKGDGVEIHHEQVGVILGADFVLTFQEWPGDAFEPVRQRIEAGRGRIRTRGTDYLAYALLDALVDRTFEVLEHLSGMVDALEQEVLVDGADDPDLSDLPRRIHALRAELAQVRKHVTPLTGTVAALQRGAGGLISDETRLYVRDLSDHVSQATESVESLRESLVVLLDTHVALAGQRLGEVTKVLTIVATLFIPLSFIAGVYGMNFDNMPELHVRWGYFGALGLMASVTLGLVLWLRKRGWW